MSKFMSTTIFFRGEVSILVMSKVAKVYKNSGVAVSGPTVTTI
jgi:hypothetical protein